jgi:hypothetical protein
VGGDTLSIGSIERPIEGIGDWNFAKRTRLCFVGRNVSAGRRPSQYCD